MHGGHEEDPAEGECEARRLRAHAQRSAEVVFHSSLSPQNARHWSLQRPAVTIIRLWRLSTLLWSVLRRLTLTKKNRTFVQKAVFEKLSSVFRTAASLDWFPNTCTQYRKTSTWENICWNVSRWSRTSSYLAGSHRRVCRCSGSFFLFSSRSSPLLLLNRLRVCCWKSVELELQQLVKRQKMNLNLKTLLWASAVFPHDVIYVTSQLFDIVGGLNIKYFDT